MKKVITYVFIDASNLFYGGEKSLGWKIDYRKLLQYLERKYKASEIFYFGGVESYKYDHDYLKEECINLEKLKEYLNKLLINEGKKFSDAQLILFDRHLQRVKFYSKLKGFGYRLFLKPVKTYFKEDGSSEKKANCDVDMAFWLMKEKDNYDHAVILSGDGDFLPVLKFLQNVQKKEIFILARGERTAKEIRRFAGGNFRDFSRLEKELRFEENKKDGHTKYPSHV